MQVLLGLEGEPVSTVDTCMSSGTGAHHSSVMGTHMLVSKHRES